MFLFLSTSSRLSHVGQSLLQNTFIFRSHHTNFTSLFDERGLEDLFQDCVIFPHISDNSSGCCCCCWSYSRGVAAGNKDGWYYNLQVRFRIGYKCLIFSFSGPRLMIRNALGRWRGGKWPGRGAWVGLGGNEHCWLTALKKKKIPKTNEWKNILITDE